MIDWYFIEILVNKVKMVTLVEGDQKDPFSIARGGRD